jgi:hypothetical protein
MSHQENALKLRRLFGKNVRASILYKCACLLHAQTGSFPSMKNGVATPGVAVEFPGGLDF